MNRTIRSGVLVVAFTALWFGGHVLAQSAGDEPGDEAGVSLPMEQEAELSPQQMRENAQSLLGDMQKMLRRVVQLQQVARKAKDVIKLNCVNEKLLQVKQLMNIADEAENNLIEAITAENRPAQHHEHAQITITHERVTGLRDEAEACIGEELVFLGPTMVEVDGPAMPDDPTDDDPFRTPVVFEDPSYVSPFN